MRFFLLKNAILTCILVYNYYIASPKKG